MTSFPRRILVTGAAGFLGRAVSTRLAARPDVDLVVATDRLPGESHDRVRWVTQDIRESAEGLLHRHRIQAIAHHAFQVRTARHEQTAYEINVGATARLADDARAAGVSHLVYPSSTTVYGAWPDSQAHTENGPLRPVPGFQYSQHKVAAEEALSRRSDLTTLILRSCVVLGPGADNFISRSLRLPILPLPSDADPPMQFLHVTDYVSAVEHALTAPDSATYNIAGRETVTVRRLAEVAGSLVVSVPEPLLRWLTDTTWRLRLQSRSPSSGIAFVQYPWLASSDLIESELGWKAQRTSLETVRDWARETGP